MFGVVGSTGPDANDTRLEINVGVAMMCLSGTAVGLRLASRRIARQPLLWDDWTIIAAAFFAWADCIAQIYAVGKGGYGKHEEPTPSEVVGFFKALYVVELVYIYAIAFIKFSILLFYRRIFSVSTTKLPAYIIGATVLAWLTALTFLEIFSCRPIDAFWNRSKPSTCINSFRAFLISAIPNIITDIVLLIFPIPLIWKLRMENSHKIAIMGIFALGGFIIIISSLRLVTIVQAQNDPEFTWSFVSLGIFNAIETNVGIILACLPSTLPLIRFIFGKRLAKIPLPIRDTVIVKSPKNRRANWYQYQRSQSDDTNSLARLKDPHAGLGGGVYGRAVTIEAGAGFDNLELSQITTPETGIRVESNIEWRSSS